MTNFRVIRGGKSEDNTPDKPEFSVQGLVAVQCVWISPEGFKEKFRTLPMHSNDRGDIRFEDADWVTRHGKIHWQSAILAPTKHDYSVDFIHVGVTAEQAAARLQLKRIHVDLAPRVWFGFSIEDDGTSHFDMQTYVTRAMQSQIPVASVEKIDDHIHVLIGPHTSQDPQREPLWLLCDHVLGAMALASQTIKGSILSLARVLISFDDDDSNIFFLEELRKSLVGAGVGEDDPRYNLVYSMVMPYPDVTAVQAICSLDIFTNLPRLLASIIPPHSTEDESGDDVPFLSLVSNDNEEDVP